MKMAQWPKSVLFISITLLLLGSVSCEPEGDQIRDVAGDVNSSNDSTNWLPVTVPPVTSIDSGIWLETGVSGEAEMRFSNETYDVAEVIMGGSTRLRTRTPDQENLYTQYDGTTFVRWLIGGEDDITIHDFGVVTPTGTMLRISVLHDRAKIAVYEGEALFVSPLKEETNIGLKEELRLMPGGKVIELAPIRFSPDEELIFQELRDIAGLPNIRITSIFYRGSDLVSEADEYVEITNLGSEPLDLTGWKLRNAQEGYPPFIFPSYTLAPGASVRVYTNQVKNEWGGFSFGHNKPIWDNTQPDIAILYDSRGREVSSNNYFIKPQHKLDTRVIGSGSISVSPNLSSFEAGTVVILTANPAAHWTFYEWSGTNNNQATTTTVTMNSDKTVIVYFVKAQYKLDTRVIGSGSISVSPNLSSFEAGTVVTLTANAEAGWTFNEWSGTNNDQINPTSVTMNSDKTVTARFERTRFTLTIELSGAGRTDPSAASYDYDKGEQVEITATHAPGWCFDHWEGDASGTSPTINVTMDSDMTVTACFEQVGPTVPGVVGVYNEAYILMFQTAGADAIANAIGVAQPGWEIMVGPGKYTESIDIHNHGIAIEASGVACETIIVGTWFIYGDDVIIDGFTFSGEVIEYGSNITIQNCSFW